MTTLLHTDDHTRTTGGAAVLVFHLGVSARTGGATVAGGGAVTRAHERPLASARAARHRTTSGARGRPVRPFAVDCREC